MTPDMQARLRRSLIAHEDYRKYPYVDTVGKITIGIGYNLTDRGISDDWINHQYNTDVEYFYHQLSQFDWFNKLNEDRKIVLLDMAFMGIKKLFEFEHMITALQEGDYKRASYEMLNSEWADQVKGRAQMLAEGMLRGVYTI